MTIHERFEQFEGEFLKFDRVKNKRSKRPDLHAFIVLDELFPDTRDMVSGAEHDEIFLSVDLGEFHAKVSDDHILELVRCGVLVTEYKCLGMYA